MCYAMTSQHKTNRYLFATVFNNLFAAQNRNHKNTECTSLIFHQVFCLANFTYLTCKKKQLFNITYRKLTFSNGHLFGQFWRRDIKLLKETINLGGLLWATVYYGLGAVNVSNSCN